MQTNANPASSADKSPWQNTFLEGMKQITRAGMEQLLKWLDDSDFFVAPASTRYHEAYEGGLVEHSVKTYNELMAINASCPQHYEAETIAICGLLHDLCKINFYKPGFRNVKDDATGKWNRVPTYTVEDSFPYGHGEKSVFMLERFIRLKPSEAIAIRWHMGGFDSAIKGGDMSLSKAYTDYPLAAMLHIADMKATYLQFPQADAEQTAFI